MGFFDRLKKGLQKTKENISNQIDGVFKSNKKVTEELFEELEEILIMGDVGVETSTKICDSLREYAKKEHIQDSDELQKAFRRQVAQMITGGEELNLNTTPSVILVIGVNGVGKTTTIGKLAMKFKKEGKRVMLAAADTFRAAAIEQLEIWANRADVDIVKQLEGSDPAAVVFDAIASAKKKKADVIICDTAGRLHNKKNLMAELAKINRIINRELPDSDKESLLVLDATTGQNAVNQAKQFKEACDITGIILTKLDGTAKGGVVLSIKDILDVPVKFIGVGEQIDDLQPFDPKSFAAALFDSDEIDDDYIENENEEQNNVLDKNDVTETDSVAEESTVENTQRTDTFVTEIETKDGTENKDEVDDIQTKKSDEDILVEQEQNTATENAEVTQEAVKTEQDKTEQEEIAEPEQSFDSTQEENNSSEDKLPDETGDTEAENEEKEDNELCFVLASGNAHKLEEFRRILEPLGVKILSKDEVSQSDFNPEETADSFAGNAKIKAEEMAKRTNLPSIADDSGLMIDALNGEPGVYSARYAGEGATDREKCELILDKLSKIPKRKRKARFVSSICFIDPKTDTEITAEGYCEGRIAFEIKGENGFGYDPIFLPKKYWHTKSFAQLEPHQKDNISHRGNSLREFESKIKDYLREIQNDNK